MRSTMLNGRRAEPDPFGGVFKQFARCPKKRMGLKGAFLFDEELMFVTYNRGYILCKLG